MNTVTFNAAVGVNSSTLLNLSPARSSLKQPSNSKSVGRSTEIKINNKTDFIAHKEKFTC